MVLVAHLPDLVPDRRAAICELRRALMETRAKPIRTLLSYAGAAVMVPIVRIPSRYRRCDTRFRD